jgi:hypothetical protein
MIFELLEWFHCELKCGNFKTAKKLKKVIERYYNNYGLKSGYKLANFVDGKYKGCILYDRKRLVDKKIKEMGYGQI